MLCLLSVDFFRGLILCLLSIKISWTNTKHLWKKIFKIKCTKNLYKSYFQSTHAKEKFAHLSIPGVIWSDLAKFSKQVRKINIRERDSRNILITNIRTF